MTIGPNKEQITQIQKPLAEQLAAEDTRIAALTKLLLEKNPVVVPATQKAVGAAVRSIAQGAANGNGGLQQALDLLKANKIAGAAQLLQVFADHKTSRTEKDREEAALA